MLRKIQVLVVDDSAVVRQQVVEWLTADPELAVVATASNGKQAIEKFEGYKPDVVVLDIEMPLMDGLETLGELRARDKRVPIIMFSTLTSRGGKMTMDALAAGATDYLLKPTNIRELQMGQEEVRRQLLEKVKALHHSGVLSAANGATPARGPAAVRARPSLAGASRVDAVVIGSSTGGPNVLETIFSGLTPDFPVPILLVQHMPPFFTKILAERLARASKLAVDEGIDGREIRAGEAWVAPGGHHMVVERSGDDVVLRIHDEPPENACRPAVDPLFRAAARVYGPHVLGVMLTGMGQDGLLGSDALVAAGGRVLAQDEASSVVWSMPGHVARAGLASQVLPAGDIAAEIVRRVRFGREAMRAL